MGSSLFWRASSVFYIESCGQENADLYKSSIKNRKIKSKASFEAERLCQFRRLTNYSSYNELGNSQPFYSLTLSYTHSHQNPCGTSFQTSRTCKDKYSVLFPTHFYHILMSLKCSCIVTILRITIILETKSLLRLSTNYLSSVGNLLINFSNLVSPQAICQV